MVNLSYLFECHFNDGTMIQQTPEDVSTIDPTRSAFYDVVQRLDEVQSFGIYNDSHTYAVDLRDGHFEIDGLPFTIHGDDQLSSDDADFRLIYFRRHSHTITLGTPTMDSDHLIEYHLGFQTTIDGKNYQRTISVR